MTHISNMRGDLKGHCAHIMEHEDLRCAMTSKLKAVGGCASHHLQGAGHIVAATPQAAWFDCFCCELNSRNGIVLFLVQSVFPRMHSKRFSCGCS